MLVFVQVFCEERGMALLIAFCPEMFVCVIEGKDRYIKILVIELVW